MARILQAVPVHANGSRKVFGCEALDKSDVLLFVNARGVREGAYAIGETEKNGLLLLLQRAKSNLGRAAINITYYNQTRIGKNLRIKPTPGIYACITNNPDKIEIELYKRYDERLIKAGEEFDRQMGDKK